MAPTAFWESPAERLDYFYSPSVLIFVLFPFKIKADSHKARGAVEGCCRVEFIYKSCDHVTCVFSQAGREDNDNKENQSVKTQKGASQKELANQGITSVAPPPFTIIQYASKQAN